jgi:hypothetical protein
LDAIGDAIGNVLHEPRGAIAIATADEMRNDQFLLGFDRGPGARRCSAQGWRGNLALPVGALFAGRESVGRVIDCPPQRFSLVGNVEMI